MVKIVLGYWNIRGVAESIRYLLHFSEVEFEDKRYSFDGKEWARDKYALELDFPNLPYYIEGDIKLTQSVTILRYLAEKFGMNGKTPEEKLQVSLLEQEIVDMLIKSHRFAEQKNFELLKPEFEAENKRKFKLFSRYLGDRDFFVGDDLTYVDFMAYEMFNLLLFVLPSILSDFRNLREHQVRMQNLPSLRKYLQSPKFKRWPISGPDTYFGYAGEEPKAHL